MNKFLITVGIGAVIMASALADPFEASAQPEYTVTVEVPVCAEEDCSDQPNQVGVWFDPDTNNRWLSLGERSIQLEAWHECDRRCQ